MLELEKPQSHFKIAIALHNQVVLNEITSMYMYMVFTSYKHVMSCTSTLNINTFF